MDDFRRGGEESQPLDRLTPRQREILRLITEGPTAKEIAGLLKISIKTAETHRAPLIERLGVYEVAGLVAWPFAKAGASQVRSLDRHATAVPVFAVLTKLS